MQQAKKMGIILFLQVKKNNWLKNWMKEKFVDKNNIVREEFVSIFEC